MSDIKTLLTNNVGVPVPLTVSQVDALMSAGLSADVYRHDTSPNKNASLVNIFICAKKNGYTNERIVANTLVYMLTKAQTIIDDNGNQVIVTESRLQNIATFLSLMPSMFVPAVFSFWKWWALLSTSVTK
jgi:hypothetical protein